MDHEYRIDGHINGRPVLGIGSGRTDPMSGTSEMEVRFEALAEDWDPRTIVLMCCDRATIMASREDEGALGMYRASGGRVTIGRHLIGVNRWGVMRDAEGRVMVDVRASSETDFQTERRFDHSTIEGGVSRLAPGRNGISQVLGVQGVMMQAGPKVVTVTTSYEALLEDCTTLYGTTFYPHFLPEQRVEVPIQLLRVTTIRQELIGAQLWVRTESAVSPLIRDRVTGQPQPALSGAAI
jgi:hypothetical protein